jgi:hypothetical protein
MTSRSSMILVSEVAVNDHRLPGELAKARLNPYGVGESGEDLIDMPARCTCCGLRFSYRTPRTKPRQRVKCDPCAPHQRTGDPKLEVERLSSHEARLHTWIKKVEAKAHEMERQNNRLMSELRDARGQVAAALQTRDRHRSMLKAVRSLHVAPLQGTKCSCGEAYPCTTEQTMRAADEGLGNWLFSVAE